MTTHVLRIYCNRPVVEIRYFWFWCGHAPITMIYSLFHRRQTLFTHAHMRKRTESCQEPVATHAPNPEKVWDCPLPKRNRARRTWQKTWRSIKVYNIKGKYADTERSRISTAEVIFVVEAAPVSLLTGWWTWTLTQFHRQTSTDASVSVCVADMMLTCNAGSNKVKCCLWAFIVLWLRS